MIFVHGEWAAFCLDPSFRIVDSSRNNYAAGSHGRPRPEGTPERIAHGVLSWALTVSSISLVLLKAVRSGTSIRPVMMFLLLYCTFDFNWPLGSKKRIKIAKIRPQMDSEE